MVRYKFVCRSCKFECISAIGKEVGLRSSKVVMLCTTCSTIATYLVAHSGNMNSELSWSVACINCQSSSYLIEWDGLTCPHCKMTMRALGGDVDADKSRLRHW